MSRRRAAVCSGLGCRGEQGEDGREPLPATFASVLCPLAAWPLPPGSPLGCGGSQGRPGLARWGPEWDRDPGQLTGGDNRCF